MKSVKAAADYPGIFRVFRPHAIEKILTQSQATEETRAELDAKGITAVIVPDDDKDHQGTVYDDAEQPELDGTESEAGK